MVDVNTQNKTISVNVSSSGVSSNVNASGDTTMYYSNKAKEWAISNRIVDGVDYSSKHYAGIAKESAENAQNIEEIVKNDYNTFLEASMTANSELQATKADAITEIEINKINAVDSMNAVKNDAVDSINSTANTVNIAIEAGVERLNSIDSLKNNQITNCILEIPQRIKYTLVDGTLTIKAGSVIIVPYGVEDLTSQYPKGATFLNDKFKVYDTQFEDGKFFVWAELQNDISQNNTTTATSKRNVCLRISNEDTEAQIQYNVYTSSADSLPSDAQAYAWYQTTNNKLVGTDGGHSIKVTCMSFPICRVVADGTYIFGSVTQLFNGLGYIGSTIWIDKGIKGLVPNGRNDDGTLNNVEYTTSQLKVFSNNKANADYIVAIETDGGLGLQQVKNYYYLDTHSLPNVGTSSSKAYIESENFWYESNSSTDYTWKKVGQFVVGNVTWTDGIITFLNSKQPFQAVSFSDSSKVSSWALPSDKYINLTLGASGTTYKAPANGWFFLSMKTTSTHGYISIENSTCYVTTQSNATADKNANIFPCRRGDTISITYGDSTVEYFRFIYAEGEI